MLNDIGCQYYLSIWTLLFKFCDQSKRGIACIDNAINNDNDVLLDEWYLLFPGIEWVEYTTKSAVHAITEKSSSPIQNNNGHVICGELFFDPHTKLLPQTQMGCS